MKIYSYQDSLKIKEKCYRGNKIAFGGVSEDGRGIPIYTIYYDIKYAKYYNLVVICVCENRFVKNTCKELEIFKRIYKNETV